jgi:hypothetical protein
MKGGKGSAIEEVPWGTKRLNRSLLEAQIHPWIKSGSTVDGNPFPQAARRSRSRREADSNRAFGL